jgi:predicted enzyme related to lactoylglutathione lyase
MSTQIKPGAVIFTGDQERLAKFYEAVAGLTISVDDDEVTVLGSDAVDLVIHPMRREPKVSNPPRVREDGYIKLFFPVTSLAETRERAAAFGGKLWPANKEWEARGFRACDGIDPDGNVIQFRELA